MNRLGLKDRIDVMLFDMTYYSTQITSFCFTTNKYIVAFLNSSFAANTSGKV